MEGLCRKTDRVYQRIIKNLKMKRHIATAIVIAALLPAFSSAQEYVSTPVEISKEKVKVEGKICYSHIVLERQTLYSISKAYGVSIDDIYRFNPSVKESGLKKNSIIIIPSAEALNATVAQKPAEESKKVEEKKAEIKKVATDKVEDKKEKAQRVHTAKWHEDLDVISEMYGVSVEDIMAANNLTGRKLNKRHKLIIPFPEDKAAVTETPSEPQSDSQADTTAAIAQTPVQETEVADDSTITTVFTPKQEVNATLVLPLTNAEGKPNRNNIDFYCGALLAVYDLGNIGIDCKVNIYDTMDSRSQMSIETISNSDIVIGPISSADLTRLFSAVPKAKIIVSPLDQRAEKLVNEHTNMIQVPTPHSAQYKDLVNWMEEEFTAGDRVLMISEKAARQNSLTAPLKEVLDSSSLAYSTFSYSILEGRDVTEPLIKLMTQEGTNRIIIASESEAFVNDVVRNLNLLIRNNIDIILYSPSKIRSFDTIEVENLHNISTHVSLTYYIDYNDPEVMDFLLKYRGFFNTEPTQFAYQGYDIAKFCMSMCAKYGDEWKNMLPATEERMLQSTFAIKKEPFKGYVNNGVRRIVYDKGYSVTAVK